MKKFICIIGPDGAGKTAVSNYVCEIMNKKKETSKLRHLGQTYIPHNKIKFKHSEDENKYKKQVPFKQKSKFHDFIANSIMTFELTLFFTLKERIFGDKKNLILDHCPYDVLLESNRRRFYKFENILLKILPQPDIIFVLYDTPENIRKRKQQRTKKEIEYYYKNIVEIIKKSNTKYKLIQVEEGIELVGDKILTELKNGKNRKKSNL